MEFFVYDYQMRKRYFSTFDDAVKYVCRYCKPGGRLYIIWTNGFFGPEPVGYYKKDISGKFIDLKPVVDKFT